MNTIVCFAVQLFVVVSGQDFWDELAEGAEMLDPPFTPLFQTEEEIYVQAIFALIIIVLILFFLTIFVFCFDMEEQRNNRVYPTKDD